MSAPMMWRPPSEEEQLRRLFELGYFETGWDVVKGFLFGSPAVTDALDHYRDFHELSGDEDPATHMLAPRCGMPDLVRDPQAAKCKWPMLHVTTSHRIGGLKPLSDEQEHAAWLEAISAWNAVCGIRLTFQEDMASANIYANPGSTGAGVLAWSYLPCGATNTSRMQQIYNRSTNWSYRLLVNVIIHEIGHAIGLDHGPRGSIMQPTAAGDITRPQSWDISEVVARYGQPGPQPPPPTPTPTPVPAGVTLEVLKPIATGRYRLVAVTDPAGGSDSDLDMG